MYTKKEIADAVCKFIANDLMDGTEDAGTRFSLCMAKRTLHDNPGIVDSFLGNPMVSGLVRESGGEYEIDTLAKTLRNVLNGYESYPVAVPGVPLFSPKGGKVWITAQDVDKVLGYLTVEPPATTEQA